MLVGARVAAEDGPADARGELVRVRVRLRLRKSPVHACGDLHVAEGQG